MNMTKISIRTSHRLAAGLLAGAALVAGVAAQAAPDTSKTDRPLGQILASHRTSGFSSVIARTHGPLTPVQQAQLTALGADVTARLPIIHSLALRLPTRNLGRLAALPFVTHLSSDGVIKKCDEFTAGSSGADTAYTSYGLDGTGIGVAVVDSGVHVTPDLDVPKSQAPGPGRGPGRGPDPAPAHRVVGTSGSIVAYSGPAYPAVNALNGPLVATNLPQTTGIPYDLCGHGTHVAGIIAGNGAWSTGVGTTHHYYGIARNANIIDVRVLDEHGQGTVSGVVAGIRWAVTNKAALKIRVMNLSLGHPVGESYTTDPLCQAVEAAYKAGIVVVCAAGNDGRANGVNDPTQSNEGWGTAYGSISSPGTTPTSSPSGRPNRASSVAVR